MNCFVTVIIFIYSFFLYQLNTTESAKIKQDEINSIESNPVTTASTTTTTRKPFLPINRSPCTCVKGECGCCTGVILERFRQKLCANVTFIPEEFAIHAKVTSNKRVMFENTISGKNPPPLCAKVPRFNFMTVCLKFSNVYFAQRNLHMCLSLEADWEGFTLIDYSFSCIRFGANGVAAVNPVEGGGLPADPLDSEEQTDEDYDDSARNLPFFKNDNPEKTSVSFPS